MKKLTKIFKKIVDYRINIWSNISKAKSYHAHVNTQLSDSLSDDSKTNVGTTEINKDEEGESHNQKQSKPSKRPLFKFYDNEIEEDNKHNSPQRLPTRIVDSDIYHNIALKHDTSSYEGKLKHLKDIQNMFIKKYGVSKTINDTFKDLFNYCKDIENDENDTNIYDDE